MDAEVIVVGAGVIGLTSAVVLAEGGRRVRVLSREPSGRTTSAVAGGLWWPYRIEPEERASAWALRSLAELTELAAEPGTTGVRMATGTMAGSRMSELGSWAGSVPGLRPAGPGELPEGYAEGLRARLPLIDMPAYLEHLRRRLSAAGGEVVETGALGSLAEAARWSSAEAVVVNCAGLGSRELVPDPALRPVQGQLVVVENPGIREWLVAADSRSSDTLYLFPQPYGLVLGGTAREDVWDLEPDPATARAIVERCAAVSPEVAGARVLGHRVGLRPSRTGGVRLEAERLPDGVLCVHNYGHGGAGATVAWGCAEETARLVP